MTGRKIKLCLAVTAEIVIAVGVGIATLMCRAVGRQGRRAARAPRTARTAKRYRARSRILLTLSSVL